MSIYVAHKSSPSTKNVSKDAMEYRLIFAVCFPFILVTTIAEKLTRKSPAISPAKSFYAETKDATHRCTSLAFTG